MVGVGITAATAFASFSDAHVGGHDEAAAFDADGADFVHRGLGVSEIFKGGGGLYERKD